MRRCVLSWLFYKMSLPTWIEVMHVWLDLEEREEQIKNSRSVLSLLILRWFTVIQDMMWLKHASTLDLESAGSSGFVDLKEKYSWVSSAYIYDSSCCGISWFRLLDLYKGDTVTDQVQILEELHNEEVSLIEKQNNLMSTIYWTKNIILDS